MTSSTDRYQALADLPFAGGYPTEESARALEDELWFALIRWYGPQQAFFDRQYKPGDFVKTTSGSPGV